MKKLFFFLSGVILIFSLNSCYTTQISYQTSYTHNVYKPMLGKTKNEAIRTYGVPDRTSDDGAGGEVLIYEKITQTTTTNVNSATYGGSNTHGAAVYGNNGAAGSVYSRNGQVSSGNGISQTTSNKAFLNLFVDKNGVIYDFKASENGDRYETKTYQTRCFDRFTTWGGVLISAVFPPLLLATIPIAIVSNQKAKKKGEICK